jgi:hypothetical protein
MAWLLVVPMVAGYGYYVRLLARMAAGGGAQSGAPERTSARPDSGSFPVVGIEVPS